MLLEQLVSSLKLLFDGVFGLPTTVTNFKPDIAPTEFEHFSSFLNEFYLCVFLRIE